MRAISNLERVVVITLVSKTGMPVRIRTGPVFANTLGVFATESSSFFSLLSSSIHFFWWTAMSELRADPRYTPSEGFEKFPQPKLTRRMEVIGEELDRFRRSVMEDTRVSLTSLYNAINGEGDQTRPIMRLREIHIEIDEAVREAYALDEECEPQIGEFEAEVVSAPLPPWREIELRHGFHETRHGTRFTISPQARADALDKLLVLNHYRYQQEVQRGLHSSKSGPASKKRSSHRAKAGGMQSRGAEGTLF
jgi:hypothetical protein